MSIMDFDGHPRTDMFERTLYYLRGNARLQVNADNAEGRDLLERIGAIEVSKAEYERADALKRGEHE